ncbi:MAG: polysaccharide biosynthesis protein [Planctomycetes bacterium]|nr:polysaccharide biosynthesis protein [Planctomycetota bacterium]
MRNYLVRLPGINKLLVAGVTDALLSGGLLLGAYWLKYGDIAEAWNSCNHLMFWAAFLGPVCYHVTGLYQEITRYIGPIFAVRVVKGVALLTIALLLISFIEDRFATLPRTVPFIYFSITTLAIGAMRLAARWLLLGKSGYAPAYPVAIFGAGAAGVGLHAAIVHGREQLVVAFMDDDPKLHGRKIRNVPVYGGDDLAEVFEKHNIKALLLALPSASRTRRRRLVETATALGIRVLTVPTLAELDDGSAKVGQLRPVKVDDLLGRTPVAANEELMHRHITGKSVLVTGAGGSIGSELCRKILEASPTRLVLLDHSEHNLYVIEKQIRALIANRRSETILETSLGSVNDRVLLDRLLAAQRIETIYHAAAYKHVPMVERHETAGVETNVFGTLTAARAALHAGVKAFVFVSTDKAVRPTSVMGASKRLAEILLQSMQEQSKGRTKFAMVRFGNVLGSSGSVIPLFQEQLERGGPVTVTHPEMVRYFMTIPEAAQLVIQAGAMANGGEVFVLDMGEPVKILDLAKNMIRLAGRTLRDESNPSGEIEIQITGTRPGEKLYEELLISDDTSHTEHPSIGLAREPFESWSSLEARLDRLQTAVDQRDDGVVRILLGELVGGYQTNPVKNR